MKIVMFSMTPLYQDRVMGGAQKILKTVAVYLGELGHDVRVLCTRRPPDVTEAYHWHANVMVQPIFRFKQPYPEPYATPIFNIANATQDLADALASADVFYSGDGGFIFPYVYRDIPTVVSLRSIIFSETLQSAFLFQGDDLILISDFQRDVILNTVGRFFPELAARTHRIYNGIDFDHYQPTDTQSILDLLPEIDPEQHDVILFPHRPEAPKGILDLIEVANQVVHEHGVSSLRVLVPRWIEEALSPDDRAFYEDVTKRISNYELREHFVFHPWIPQSLMPALYSVGRATMVIGSYLETFGNVPYESLACGTPAILSRVGVAREILPEGLVDKVNYGDIDAAAAITARIIKQKQRVQPETLAYLKQHYQQETMVRAYADVILNAKKRGSMAYQHRDLNEASWQIAPWVYHAEGDTYFHDIHARYEELPSLAGLALNLEEHDRLYRDGWLVPVD